MVPQAASRIANLPLPGSFRNGERFAFDKVDHTFFGWTADARAQLMGPQGLLQVRDERTGCLVYPDKSQLLQLMATKRLVRRIPVANAVRAKARARRLTRADVEASKGDRAALLRMEIISRFAREQPSRGDLALEAWRDEFLNEHTCRTEFGIWPAGSTIRNWVRTRGTGKDRRWSDVTSERGRKRGPRRHRSVVALAAWHAVACAKMPAGNAWASWCLYQDDHKRLLAREPLSFDLEAELPQPPGDPKPYCYERFRQMVREANLPEVVETRSGRRGRRKRFDGGGASPEVTKLFEAVQLDAQFFPAIVLVDMERGAAMGMPVVTLTIDRLTKVAPGLDVAGSAPSTTTLMRTIADMWRPSFVPARFADDYPELALIGGAFDALEMDSGAENTSRAMEDLVGDIGSEMRIATPDAPMDKSDIERLQQTIQTYLASEMQSRVLDVRTRRELGLDATEAAVLPFDVFVDLLREAIATYHLQFHKGIGTTPLEAFLVARKRDGHDWPADVDQFEEAAAEVEYDVRLERTGFTLKCGLRYSCHSETPRLLAEELAAAHGLGSARKGWIKRKVKSHADDLGRASVWSEARGEYVSFPCTRPDYATGLPLWLHEQISNWAGRAGRTGRPVITEEEQIAARAGFVALVRNITHALDPAQRALQFKLMSTPSVRTWVGDDVVDLLREPATADGPPDAIHREFAAPGRKDGHVRRPRGKRDREDEWTGADDDALAILLALEAGPAGPPSETSPASPSGLERPGKTGRIARKNGSDDPDDDDPTLGKSERRPPTQIDYDYD